MKFHAKKRQEVLKQLNNSSIAFLCAGAEIKETADEFYPFSVNRNFYYLTGIDEADVILVLIKGRKEEERLYIKKSDPLKEKWYAKTISREEAIAKSGVQDVRYLDDLKADMEKVIAEEGIVNVYVDDEEDPIIHHGLDLLDSMPAFDEMDVYNVYEIVAKLRAVKEPEEIEEMRKAIHITNEGIMNMLDHMKPGMKEYELQAYYTFVLNSHQVPVSFTTIAASGINATVLHYSTNNSVMQDNDMILFDLGVAKNRYCSDISRTFPINGKYSEKQRLVYDIVLRTQKKVMDAVKPGVTIRQLNNLTLDCYAKELKEIGLIEKGTYEEVANYYWHSIGHSLGLDTHDVGLGRDEPLRPGMVITDEPGLYIAEWGIGVRIEDDILVTEDGHECLSEEIIKDPDAIEAYLANRK